MANKAGGRSADLLITSVTVIVGLFAACLFIDGVDGEVESAALWSHLRLRTETNLTAGNGINIRNQCSQTITACATCDPRFCGTTNCYVLTGGNTGQQLLQVGSSWPGGLIWGFPGSSGSSNDGIQAKPEADLAEFTIGGPNGQDSYDISLVNAYNLPLMINPTFIAGGGQRSGLHCGTPSCTISDALTGFCQSPNRITGGPGDGCYNIDGPGNVATSGTQAFANRCPNAYSYSKDDANHVYGCETGSNYDVIFCP